MRMRKYSKKKIEMFHKAQAEMLAPFQSDPDGWLPGSVRCMTDHGPLVIHPEKLEPGDVVTSICSRFREVRPGLPYDANPYSGKWNVCCWDPEYAVTKFTEMLQRVNARPLNDEERAEWVAWKEEQRKKYLDNAHE